MSETLTHDYFQALAFILSPSNSTQWLWLALAFLLAVSVFLVVWVFNRQKTLNVFRKSVYDDELTGLKNSVFLRENFNNILLNIDRELTFYHLTIDNFKNHNDLLGRQLADQLLIEVADRLKKIIDPYSSVYRLHSDHFILLYPTYADQDSAFIQKLITTLKEPYIFNIHTVAITVSVGAFRIGSKNPRYNECLLHSELALQSAKDNGKDQFVYYSDRIKQKNQASYDTFKMIKEALKDNRFFLEYQPIVDANSYQIVGFESLLRLKLKDRIFFPQDIINYAERFNLIEDIDRFVIKESFAALKRLTSVYPKLSFISINVSGKEITNHHFLEYVLEQVALQGVSPSKITFEFTESYNPDDFEMEANFIKSLQDQGFKVAIDDFGSGYSSMVRLSLNKLDKIKIDRSFITGIAYSKTNQKIVEAIVGLSKTFNLEIIVEGVETQDDVDYLKDVEINYIQGYRFYQSLDEASCLELLNRLNKEKNSP